MAVHAPITGARLRAPSFPTELTGFLRELSRFERGAIEDFISAAIDMLDQADGDPDIEDDDPGGDALDRGEAATDDGYDLLLTRPIYALDQSLGPINEREAVQAYHYRLNHRGAVA